MQYPWKSAESEGSHSYLTPAVLAELEKVAPSVSRRRLLEIGSGNGALTSRVVSAGWDVVGIEPSAEGREQIRQNYPDISVHDASAYDDLAARFGRFPVVLSVEVIEHLYSPATMLQNVREVLEPGGKLVLTTPYHGYLKYLVLAALGQMDRHLMAETEYGHVKFWSIESLTRQLDRAGLRVLRVKCAGRFSPIWKSMIFVCERA